MDLKKESVAILKLSVSILKLFFTILNLSLSILKSSVAMLKLSITISKTLYASCPFKDASEHHPTLYLEDNSISDGCLGIQLGSPHGEYMYANRR
jgi:hypothetical protein